ncbi:MAG: hypothetical protein ACRDJ2_00350 [Actinomycetota bacterium]
MVAGIQALVIGSLGLFFGYLVVDALARLFRIDLDATASWGLAPFGFTAVVTALTLVHIATAGAIFSNTRLTQGVLLGVAVAAAATRFVRRRPRSTEREANLLIRWMPLLLVILAYVLWTSPVFELLPQSFNGDTTAHAFRASKFLTGESTPSPPLTGDIPNDYPYLFHAEAATFARVTPGGRILHAYGPLQVFFAGGAVLALYALGRELRRWTSGFFLALFGALTGGFGWVISRSPELIIDVHNLSQAGKYLGDFLVKRSYNVTYANLAPPFPRDLSYALFGCFLLLLIMGLKRKSVPLLIGAGVTTGMFGLTGGEAFFTAMGISVVVIAIGAYRRFFLVLALLVPAVGLYACWAVPIVLNYLEFGGFEDLSANPVSLTPLLILGSWGLTTPFALYGGFRALPEVKSSIEARIMLIAVVVPAVAVLGTSLAGSTLPEGISTLGRPHRYWPMFYLGLALSASIGAALFAEWLGRLRWYVAATASLIIVAISGLSPLISSLQYGRQIREQPKLHAALTGDSRTALDIVSPYPQGNCVVAVPPLLSRVMAGYSGYRLVFYKSNPRSPARIRWPDLPLNPPYGKRLKDNQSLVTGAATPARLDRLIQRYSLDIVVTAQQLPPAPIYEEFESVKSSEGYTVVTINPDCRSERFQRP